MLKITKPLLVENIDGYTNEGQSRKDAFHSAGKKFLRMLAEIIGLTKGEFDIRSNVGGIAGSGEVTLHGESIYVQLSESFMHRGVSILYRTCDGRKDYSGGFNRWMKMSDLQDENALDRFLLECRRMTMEMENA